jgi:hypothetical protein
LRYQTLILEDCSPEEDLAIDWCIDFLLEIDYEFLQRKTAARLNLEIKIISLVEISKSRMVLKIFV